MSNMITQVRIRGYKSLSNVVLHLRDVNYLVGSNGAGKSSIAESLERLTEFKSDNNPKKGSSEAFYHLKEIILRKIVYEHKNKLYVDWAIRSNFGTFNLLESLEKNKVIDMMSSISRMMSSISRQFGVPEDLATKNTHSLLIGTRIFNTSITKFLNEIDNKNIFKIRIIKPITNKLVNPIEIHSQNEELLGTASNLFDILHLLSTSEEHTERWDSILYHMKLIAPQIEGMSIGTLGSFRLLQYTTRTEPSGELVELDSSGMSDGMLRALALLTAVYQPNPPMTLIVEEPELHLHPRALELLLIAMLEAPDRPQLIFTTHSPAILDMSHVKPEEIIVVDWQDGQTVAGSISEENMRELKARLVTGGELLVEGGFQPKPMEWIDFDEAFADEYPYRMPSLEDNLDAQGTVSKDGSQEEA